MNKDLPLWRIGFVLGVAICFEAFLITRFASLQLFQHSKFRERVKGQSHKRVKLTPERGKIYDRYHRIMATTIDSRRIYPLSSVAGNLLGFVGKDGVGLEGIEYEFDALLSGAPGWEVLAKTPGGKLYRYPGYPRVQAQPAKGLILTLDADIQAITEVALKKRLTAVHGKSGSAIVLCPRTGEILAIATVPCCNPNDPMRFRSWRNRPLQVQFEPGSTFKLIPIVAIIRGNLISLSDTVEDGSSCIEVQGKVIRDHKPHGPLTFTEAIWKSSNAAFVRIGNKIGRKQLYDEARAFGFGAPTGITLPGEAHGSLSFPDSWSDLELANIAFGQGLSCSLLQLALAYSVIANAGILLKPVIVKEVIDRSGRLIYKSNPVRVRTALSPEQAAAVKELLCGVVEQGTGALGKVPGLRIAAKTGTGQKFIDGQYRDTYVATFVGFFPAEEPQFLIACMINEPDPLHLGGIVCGPLFKDIAEKIMKLKPYKKIIEPPKEEVWKEQRQDACATKAG